MNDFDALAILGRIRKEVDALPMEWRPVIANPIGSPVRKEVTTFTPSESYAPMDAMEVLTHMKKEWDSVPPEYRPISTGTSGSQYPASFEWHC